MSGLTKHLKRTQEALLQVKNVKKKFTTPSVSPGSTVWPNNSKDQARLGFRWDLDVPVKIPDNRPNAEQGTMRDANRFKLQANAQAEAKTIKEWVNKQGKKGTHADVTFVDIPVDASDDEFEEIMDPDALMEEID